MSRPLAPHGGNDDVMTPRDLAASIITHFSPMGAALDPCCGDGAFLDQFPFYTMSDWCEIKDGRDFLTWNFKGETFNWIMTNPPWSQFRPFLKRSMQLADNIVFLCLVNAFFMKARVRDMDEAAFRIREILFLDTPPAPWPQTGFQLGAVHVQKGWKGDVKVGRL